jgi:hypothetical protein
VKLSTRQASPQVDREPHRPAPAVHVAPARQHPAPAGGNAAIHRMVRGGSARGDLSAFAAGGGRALQRLCGPGHTVAPKLTVSQPHDPAERQAEAVAARVASGAPTPGFTALAPATVSREPAAGDVGAEVPAGLSGALRDPGAGAPIPAAVRAQVEPHLGVDLSAVQVHAGGSAATAAAQLDARAFTTGTHIYLGAGESANDVALMAHEATHVAQQAGGTAAVGPLYRDGDSILPDFILDGIKTMAKGLPGYTMLTVVAGYDPIANRNVERTPENLVRGVIGLVPFGTVVADKIIELGIIQKAFQLVNDGLAAHNLTLARIQGELDQVWNELSITKGIDGNVAVIAGHVDKLYQDALSFARGVVDSVVQLVRDAAVGLAEKYLVGTPSWDLAKKVLHHDPLRGTPVEATTVEILSDFLKLIGKQDALAQMQERGTLQKTADWLDTQIPRFLGLVGELGALFKAGWEAIQPQNIASLPDNLSKLAHDAVGLIGRVAAFAGEVIVTVLKLVKEALLGWLSQHAHEIKGFRLLTVILGQNPFTGQAVARSAENLIGGFIALLPNGEAMYTKLSESGVIAEAGAQIEGAMARLGISLDMITQTFKSIWDTLKLEDLLNPIGAFIRVLEKFGEPLGRIVAFAGEVLKVVIGLVLKLMNLPSDLMASIINHAMQAIEDIKKDPVAFLMNMLQALKTGFLSFLDKIGGYLLDGLADWLFRGLGALGISKPPDYSLKSILDLVLQVIGVSVETLWEKLGKQIGPEKVAKIRAGIAMAGEAWQFIKDVQEGGVAAIWKYVEDKLGNLWDTLLNMAKDWIVSKIIDRVTAKLISMLDPTGIMAVVNSMIAFYNAVESAIEYIREILMIVNDYVTTLAAIAAGNIGAGAAKVEKGLANAVPVAIGFLANQVGLGNVPEKVVEIIKGLRQIVDEALDWLFAQAMRLGQAALSALGLGGGDDKKAEDPSAGDFAVHESVQTPGDHKHEVANVAGSFELTVASDRPTGLDKHPDQAVRDAFATYRAAVKAAAPEGKKKAAQDNLKPVLDAVRASTGLDNPQASAPGIGQIRQHGRQPARLTEGPKIWWLESEHVLPFDMGANIWDVLGEYRPERGFPEDMQQVTIMIYERAANEKTGQDQGIIQRFKANLNSAEINKGLKAAAAIYERDRPGALALGRAALQFITDPLREAVDDAVERTCTAITNENRMTEPGASMQNGERRARPGQREPDVPTEGEVRQAANKQYKVVLELATTALRDSVERANQLRRQGFSVVD